MGLKTFKSYTKSTRGTVLVDRKNLWKGKSLKSLTVGQHSTGGRNNLGRITSRSRGSGHKHKYREIDFYRKKDDLKAKVDDIKNANDKVAIFLLQAKDDKVMMVSGIKGVSLKAGDWIKKVAPILKYGAINLNGGAKSVETAIV